MKPVEDQQQGSVKIHIQQRHTWRSGGGANGSGGGGGFFVRLPPSMPPPPVAKALVTVPANVVSISIPARISKNKAGE